MSQTLGYRPNPTPEPRPQKEVDLLRRAQILDAHTKAAAEAKDRERIRQSTPFELMTRPIAPDDYHFVLNAWMKSYRDSKRLMRNETYFVGQQNLIAEIAKRRNCIVGCDASMPEWIAGFAAGQMLTDGRLLLDYVYVKSPYRSRGIGLQLIGALGWSEGTPIVATHSTKCADKIARKYEVTYDEYFNAIGYSDV